MQQTTPKNTQVIPWWQGASGDVCVLESRIGADTFEAATTFEGLETGESGVIGFRYYPDLPVPEPLPDTVRLIVPSEDGTTTYRLHVVSSEGTLVRVASEPLAVHHRRLRRTPRIPYHLGPCAAVVHGASGQWRGVIEFWVSDVSEYGVGFKAELGRAFLLSVGDNIRAPITLPDGRRSWLDGQVTWLTPEGRGGMVARRAPQWVPTVSEQSA